MGRPLTVADRVPQVGDVLGHPVHFPMGDNRVGGGEVAEVFSPEVFRVVGAPIARRTHKWFYISRADGGPITIEEGG